MGTSKQRAKSRSNVQTRLHKNVSQIESTRHRSFNGFLVHIRHAFNAHGYPSQKQLNRDVGQMPITLLYGVNATCSFDLEEAQQSSLKS